MIEMSKISIENSPEASGFRFKIVLDTPGFGAIENHSNQYKVR